MMNWNLITEIRQIHVWKTKVLFFLLSVSLNISALSQTATSIVEYEKEYVTYPYSDPNPIPSVGKIYPYYRFDGYTTQSKKQFWRVVELENDYLRIQILPEIGGKIWSVLDKKTGSEMFYNNDVIKFRDVSLRGPWTSGGIEFNYGVVGHAPSCSFPVDYMLRTNPDRSSSCIISTFDLLTRTRWTVEINLPADKALFTTKSFWHNSNASFQPYYNWVNAGVSANDDLQFTYPGNYIIGHDGKALSWPQDKMRNKDLSIWRENDFGGSKSYHIVGSSKPFFGAYWAMKDFGLIQSASRDQKIGKKMFSWALSDQGKIWKELLTDHSGQYVEMQSGRLFNQNMVISSLTPFKQIQFAPYATDKWVEYWFPYHGIGKATNVCKYGASNITVNDGEFIVRIYPISLLKSTLCFLDADGKLLYGLPIELSATTIYSDTINTPKLAGTVRITLGGQEIWQRHETFLNRPVETAINFDWDTPYGNYLRGRDLMGMRLYDQAEEYIRKSLALDSNYIPALVEMSAIQYKKMEYDSAYLYARRALSIDTYDARANFEYARASWRINHTLDSQDGYELATLNSALRSAAYTELSRLFFLSGRFAKAREYAQMSLINNSENIEALKLVYLCDVIDKKKSKASLLTLKELDPLNPFIMFEEYYQNKTDSARRIFIKSQRGDMMQQTLMELGIYYYGLGLKDRAISILSLLPSPDSEALYWLAFLYKNTSKSKFYLNLAEKVDPLFVFPFREEGKDVFEWADTITDSWKPKYFLALLHLSKNNKEKARLLLDKLGNNPKFSPLYALRANLCSESFKKESDYRRAVKFSPNEWRYIHLLTRFYIEEKQYKEAIRTIEPFYYNHKEHFPTGCLYTKVLMLCQDYEKAEKILSSTYILPFEGERSGRLFYKQIKLMLALQALNKGMAKKTIMKVKESFLWPRNIGVGKPYDNTIDQRLEDWLLALSYMKLGNSKKAYQYFNKVANSSSSKKSINALLQALALHRTNKKSSADQLFEEWISLQTDASMRKWGKVFYDDNKTNMYPLDHKNLSLIVEMISGPKDVRLF